MSSRHWLALIAAVLISGAGLVSAMAVPMAPALAIAPGPAIPSGAAAAEHNEARTLFRPFGSFLPPSPAEAPSGR
jgi:hypothetical protein